MEAPQGDALTREAIRRINQSFNHHFRRTDDGFQPYVCITCDRILSPKEVRVITPDVLERNAERLKPNALNKIPEDLAACCKYEGHCGHSEDRDWIRELLLSPRSAFISTDELPPLGTRRTRSVEGFAGCERCFTYLCNSRTPNTPSPTIMQLELRHPAFSNCEMLS